MKKITFLKSFLIAVLFLVGNYSVYGQYAGTGIFTKISTASELESGAYYVLYGVNGTYNAALTNTISGGRMGATAVTLTDNTIVNPSEAIVWKIEGNTTDGFTVYNEAISQYCEIATNSTSGFSLSNTSTHTYTPSATNTDDAIFFKSNSETGGNRGILLYQADFRPYTISNTNSLFIYKYVPVSSNMPYIETFNNTLGDWFSYEVSGTKPWLPQATGAYMNGYGGGDVDSWLISPEFISSTPEGLAIAFNYATKYTGNDLVVKVSNDYAGSGDPSLATWSDLTSLTATVFDADYTVKPSGNIITTMQGNLYFALVYTASEGYSDWRITDLTVNVIPAAGTPTIAVTEVTIPNMAAYVDADATQTINVSGENLTANITMAITGTDADLFQLDITEVTQTDGTAASTEVTITYSPNAPGMHTATLTLSSEGADNVVRTLTGKGIDPANPYGLDNSSPVSELNETFEAPTVVGTTMPANWTNASAQGTKNWEIKLYNENQYAQMGAYGSTGVQQTLLISPAINFDQIVKTDVTFDWLAGYAKVGTTLKVHTMTLDGTKTEVKSIDAAEPTSAYSTTYTNETLDLTAVSGVKFLVFEYNGDAALTTTYQIDNVVVLKKEDTGLTNTKNHLEISTANGNIKFSAASGESVEIYNAVGQRIISQITVEGANTISVSAHGVVLVKVGNRFAKVIL